LTGKLFSEAARQSGNLFGGGYTFRVQGSEELPRPVSGLVNSFHKLRKLLKIKA
jgi:hypothetical protein